MVLVIVSIDLQSYLTECVQRSANQPHVAEILPEPVIKMRLVLAADDLHGAIQVDIGLTV